MLSGQRPGGGAAVTRYEQATSPGNPELGSFWIDSSDAGKTYYWNGSFWVDISNSRFEAIVTGEASTLSDSAKAELLTEWQKQIATEQYKLSAEFDGAVEQSRAEFNTAVAGANAATALVQADVNAARSEATAALATAKAEIDADIAGLTAADTAISTQISSLTSTVNNNTAAISNEAVTRANADSALSASLTSLQTTVGNNKAALDSEVIARTNADSALSASISSLTSTVNSNKASADNSIATLANADSALSASISSLTSTVNNNTAAINNEAVTRANADSALSASLTSLQTTVGNNSASITNLQGSYNGLSVKYGIVGTINGQTGGFVFSGIGKNDGSVVYNLEIGANVTINGSLIVNGTIKNQGLEDYAASNSGMSIGVKNSGNVSVRVRKNARVACIASYSGHKDDWSYPGRLKIRANGNVISDVEVNCSIDYVYGLAMPMTTFAVYPGNVGTRIQGNGQASASAEYSYTEQYVAYYVWVGFPAPVYASRTVSFPAAYAFDDSQSSTWLAPKSGSPWIKYIFAQSVQVGAYKVMGFSSLASGSTQGRAPKAWSLQASNDGTNWTTLDTRSNQTGWGDQEDRQFQISGTNGVYNNYTQYRMVITESVDANETLVGVVQLSFFLPGDVSDSQNVVFNAFIDSSSNFLGNVSIYVVELSK